MSEVTQRERFLNAGEVQRFLCISASSFQALRRDSSIQFPRAIEVTPRAVRWRLSEIEAWLEKRRVEA